MTLAPGMRLGRYEILAPLGAGGMGEVYRARDTRLGREVALKTIAARSAADADARLRFEHEMRAIAALSHPSILAIHDVGMDDGMPYAVMELLDGETLRARLERGPLPWAEAVAAAAAIAAGLAAAHDKGILHRDLKPENLFLTRDGRVKILDFGLACLCVTVPGPANVGTALTEPLRTQPGDLLGTPGYMSPEQLRGLPVDAPSDLFALGAVLFEMLTGRPAFRRATAADSIVAALGETRESIGGVAGDLSADLDRILGRCLAPDPAARPAAARALARELDALLHPALAAPPTAPPPRRIASIAVMAFADLSAARDQQWLCDGISEEILSQLARLSGLRVASRTSAFRFRDGSLDVREIGRQLGVRAVLEGSVRRAGDRLRITAQLVDVETGYQLWSEPFDRGVEDIFNIQEETARRIVAALEVTLSDPERRALGAAPTRNVEAYEHYLRGRAFFHQARLRSLEAARQMFVRALELDPGFARAHAGLAYVHYWRRVWYGGGEDDVAQALAAGARALELDPELAEAHAARAVAASLVKQNEEAEREFLAAIALDASLFEPHYLYARLLFSLGRLDESAEQFRRAMERAPEDYQAPTLLALTHFAGGRNREALALCRIALKLCEAAIARNPDDSRALYLAAGNAMRLGDREQALALARRAVALDPSDVATLYNVGCMYASAGMVAEGLDYVSRAIDAGLGDRGWLEHDPDLEALRGDPRFAALLARTR